MEQSTRPKGGRILLVDDDVEVRRDFARMLGSLGCSVTIAEEGAKALRILREEPAFDLILSDVSMPGMKGTELLSAVREIDLDVPVVLITGMPDVDSAIKAVEYGAFRYLTKPVELSLLETLVRRALLMHRLAKLKRAALELGGLRTMSVGDRATLEGRFSRALEQLWMAFQPIVHWPARRVFGYEALVRSSRPLMSAPEEIIGAAERLGRVHELGQTLRRQVAQSIGEAPDDAVLFVNLHATDLDDEELFALASPLSQIAHRVVLEITEQASLDEIRGLGERMSALRGLGFRIAADDLGTGYAGIRSLTQIEPEFVKLDRSLIHKLHRDTRKEELVRSLLTLCQDDLGMRVIAEGVEQEEERDCLLAAGCELFQGFLFAKPDPAFLVPPGCLS